MLAALYISCVPLLHIDSTIFLLPKSEFVSDLAGNPEDRFSPDVAHFYFK